MERLLVPLDGSRLAEAVLPLAETLAREHGAELFLLRALRAEDSVDAETAAQREAESYLEATAGDTRARGLPAVRWLTWYDEPAPAIANGAAANAIELIVMATHGRSGLGRLLLGSVAEGVVRKTTVPVLLVRGELPRARGDFGKILVPLDGSELAEGVLPVVERLTRPAGGAVVLVHAVEPVVAPTLAETPIAVQEPAPVRTAEAEEYLSRVADGLEVRHVAVTCAVRLGPAVSVIHDTAAATGAGLIAMSTHGRTGLGRLIMGSVAEQVLRSAPVPVLLWRAPTGPTTASH
jgi:nucleotide-binding universal stress UspA family protein